LNLLDDAGGYRYFNHNPALLGGYGEMADVGCAKLVDGRSGESRGGKERKRDYRWCDTVSTSGNLNTAPINTVINTAPVPARTRPVHEGRMEMSMGSAPMSSARREDGD
jgi:hypothetical protein